MIFSPDKPHKTVIGAIFSGKHISVARIENSQVAQLVHHDINNYESEEIILGEIIKTIKSVFTDDVAGIGVGVPSLVDVKNGVVNNPQRIPSWHQIHLKDILEEHFNVPAYINNDANCFALGEKHFGAAKHFENVVGIIIDSGMGSGVIINNKLYSGHNAGAGEFGSIPYKDYTYEHYCSIPYFEEKYGIKHNILLARAQNKDKIALAIFEIFGTDLGNAIKSIMFALDPDAIIIGGCLAEAYEFFEESMLKTVNTFIHKGQLKNTHICKASDPYTPIYGAAYLCFE